MSDASTGEELGTIRIRNQDILTRTVWIEQAKLSFFVDNPRIYSLVRTGGKMPNQSEIYQQLLDLDHVRELKTDISRNGGLIDPLIVRDGDFEVLEGNCRLAAYRWLYQNSDPIVWAHVKCTILPANTDERLIFALLGQYHVKGKKDWVPFEKAGFIYRRFQDHHEDLATIASELGIPQREARHLINVYEFMIKHDETERERWSYYDEYLKSRRIKKVRELHSNFDDLIVSKIRMGEIKRAVDVRDSLSTICGGAAKTIKKFVEGKIDFDEAHSIAADAGGDNPDYRRLFKFRQWLAEAATEADLLDTPKHVRDKIEYELSMLDKRIKKLKSRLEAVADDPPAYTARQSR